MSRRRSSAANPVGHRLVLQKPNGVLTPRVQAVGPDHFGIVAFDCAKARSWYLLADFYGQVLLEPTRVSHTHGDFQAAIARLRQAMQQHDLRDVVVAIERTGDYHRPVQRAFRDAGFETRLVHPLTSKQFRQPANPYEKTDPNDTAAVFRAAAQGFGLLEPDWPADYQTIQLLRRHRRDLVAKNATLYCQIREVLHAAMPGYAECFCHLWESPAPLVLARQTTSAAAVLQEGVEGLARLLEAAHVRYQKSTLPKVLAWARQAPPGHGLPLVQRRILTTLDDDRLRKTAEILALERDLAQLVVRTPYALLLAIPGINIVTVADLAGELGPPSFYADATNITGRAGLMPSRYQSDQVDYPNGPLPRRGNRRLRAVLLQTADNLIQCNHYFKAKNDLWNRQGKDPRWIRVKVAKSFTRLAFVMVVGGQLVGHPCCQPRSYVLGKLLAFHVEHRTPGTQLQDDLLALTERLPTAAKAAEAQPLQEQLDDLARRRGPQPLAAILTLVLARLGMLQSATKEEDPG